jgi:hypothetical protein
MQEHTGAIVPLASIHTAMEAAQEAYRARAEHLARQVADGKMTREEAERLTVAAATTAAEALAASERYVEIPGADMPKVQGMNRHERRAWAAQQRGKTRRAAKGKVPA